MSRNRPVAEPHNLGKGWVGFDSDAAFKTPVKVVNDAAMQALGSYKGGKMLFLGLGTGLGSALIADGNVKPMELGHLPYKKATYEDYVGLRGLEKHGQKKWRKHVTDVVERLVAALEPDDAVLGEATSSGSKAFPRVAAPATTPTRSSEAFDCGRRKARERKKALPGVKEENGFFCLSELIASPNDTFRRRSDGQR